MRTGEANSILNRIRYKSGDSDYGDLEAVGTDPTTTISEIVLSAICNSCFGL